MADMNDLQWLAKRRETRLNLVNKTEPQLEQPEPTLRKNEDREHPFWGEPASEETGEDGHPFWGEREGEEVEEKARTYLKPGEEAPEGTEAQEGPRGGRYYEGKPGAAKPTADVAGEAGWEDIEGTFRVGEVDISGQDLIDALGPPHWTPDEGESSKSQAMWAFKFRDGMVATVYDYKTGKSYLGEEGQDVQETTDWHIGGKDKGAAERVKSLIEAKRGGGGPAQEAPAEDAYDRISEARDGTFGRHMEDEANDIASDDDHDYWDDPDGYIQGLYDELEAEEARAYEKVEAGDFPGLNFTPGELKDFLVGHIEDAQDVLADIAEEGEEEESEEYEEALEEE